MNQTDNLYEAIIIFAPTLTPQEAQAELESIDDKVRSRGITVQQTVAPFKKKLPYTVRHFSNGYFCAVTFTAEKDPMQIVHILKNSKNILRIGIGRNTKDIAQAPLFASSTLNAVATSQNAEPASAAPEAPHATRPTHIPATPAETIAEEKSTDDAPSAPDQTAEPGEDPSAPAEHNAAEEAENKEETLKKIDEELDKILQGVK